ncbi:MJ0042-type zinc finger domain-containing protein [Desulfatitalea alkaliphila]|uniref:Zinc-ribbon domain-containing protein n=1 Tax=Desulfatitalea alkaliphila TaxID=2929485 RepID=A0AA41R097_9BACT|nr:MJ0042-type zinc finger domain-containing protein [Desulfatitalea alkaliphila]MCJ8500447.1 zinc-ribbon domain-containing protein [Desulfatitalea alkaliphila]
MEVVCDNCQGKLRIADDKVPAGKTAFVKCPRCQSRVSVSGAVPAPEPEPEEAPASLDDLFDFTEEDGEAYDAAEKPFDFIEEEGKTAMVCEADALIREKLRPTLDLLEYHITEVPNSREALKKMRYHTYDLILLNEYFDTRDPDANAILIYLERQPMETRRNIFVTLLTTRYRTMDHMTAFQKSVNMILNLRNIDDIDKILQRGMADYGLFYKVFKESVEL